MRDRFFDGFRASIGRLPAGLTRVSSPATREQLAETARALARPLPEELASFLTSWNGVELFHDGLVVLAAGASLLAENPPRAEHPMPPFRPGDLVFAIAGDEDRYVLAGDPACVYHVQLGSDERWLAGSALGAFLESYVAREGVLYDREGEFVEDAFDLETGTITPIIALRQAERALKKDPGAAELHHQHGLALRRLGRASAAAQAFARAATLDTDNPWPWFERGRTLQGDAALLRESAHCFAEAARRLDGAAAGRMHAYRARVLAAIGDDVARGEARAAALACDPALSDNLARAAQEAFAAEDSEGFAEADTLRAALASGQHAHQAPVRKLPVLRQAPPEAAGSDEPIKARPTRPATRKRRPDPARARPRKAAKPRRGAPR